MQLLGQKLESLSLGDLKQFIADATTKTAKTKLTKQVKALHKELAFSAKGVTADKEQSKAAFQKSTSNWNNETGIGALFFSINRINEIYGKKWTVLDFEDVVKYFG